MSEDRFYKSFEPTEDRITLTRRFNMEGDKVTCVFTNKATGKVMEVECDPDEPGYESKARREISKEIWR